MTGALIPIATLCLLIFTGCGFVVHETYTEASDSTNRDGDHAEQTHFVIAASGFSAGSTYTINGRVDSDSDEDFLYLEVYNMPTVRFSVAEDGVMSEFPAPLTCSTAGDQSEFLIQDFTRCLPSAGPTKQG